MYRPELDSAGSAPEGASRREPRCRRRLWSGGELGGSENVVLPGTCAARLPAGGLRLLKDLRGPPKSFLSDLGPRGRRAGDPLVFLTRRG